ncbi:hypothetical protein [Streptomyces sp. JW3]|uniref:hypothetical protein n=1 Tax=Streptomyces sp. JW3 TaxID=3456955 RepID=UPI003FA4A0E5
MFAWLFLWLVLLGWLTAGVVGHVRWRRLRRPARHRRWWVAGAGLVVLGYAHALAYGLALTRPAEICGQRTLDDDFPLRHARADVFPPDLSCYWSDSLGYGPSHPTAAGTWVMWWGAALLVAGTVARVTALPSRAPRWARAGLVLTPAVAAVLWLTQVAPLMRMSAVDPGNECFRWQVAHLHSAPSGEVVATDRGLLPVAVDCVFTDGTASLIPLTSVGLWSCCAAFLGCCAALRPLRSPVAPGR